MGGIARTFLCIIVQGLRLFPRYDDSLEQVGTELGQAQLKLVELVGPTQICRLV